jgi:hypothetical protein
VKPQLVGQGRAVSSGVVLAVAAIYGLYEKTQNQPDKSVVIFKRIDCIVFSCL